MTLGREAFGDAPAQQRSGRHGLVVGTDALERVGVPARPQRDVVVGTEQRGDRVTQLLGLIRRRRDGEREVVFEGVGRDRERRRERTR